MDNLLDFELVNERIVKFVLNLISPVCVFSFLRPISILSPHLNMWLPHDVVPSGLQTNYMCK